MTLQRSGSAGHHHDAPSLIPYGLMVVTIAIATLAVLAMLFLNDARGLAGEESGSPSPTVNDFPVTE